MDLLIDEITKSIKNHQGLALATIISRNGSAPRRAGAQMIIRADGSIAGTVGGGMMEAQVIQIARKVIENQNCDVTRIEMTGETAATGDMICGGIQDVLVEYLDPANQRLAEMLDSYQSLVRQRSLGWWITQIPSGKCKATAHFLIREDGSVLEDGVEQSVVTLRADKPQEDASQPESITIHLSGQSVELENIKSSVLKTIGNDRWLIDPIVFYGTVYLFGAGHVSQQLAKVTGLVGFRTVVIDDREEFANRKRFPDADEVLVVPDYHHLFEKITIDPESYMVIVTRGHLFDRYVLAQCLQSKAVYIGMIGSKRKIRLVYEQLEKEGYSREQLEKVHSPIGMMIGAETPEEIAVSITAELIQCRNEIKRSDKSGSR